MAIGTARLFGYRFPPNFNYPYRAASATEFWRRWHMSLSFWLRNSPHAKSGWAGVSSRLAVTSFEGQDGLAADSRGDIYVGEVSWTAWPQIYPVKPHPADLRSLQKFEKVE
jgi:hypothetical protein